MGRLARHLGYTITALVDELVERAERRVTGRAAIPRAWNVCRQVCPYRMNSSRNCSLLSGMDPEVFVKATGFADIPEPIRFAPPRRYVARAPLCHSGP
jgi:hypothetical protein